MKMKKVLSLALAAVMALGSFGFASADTATADKYERIVESGIFVGDNGDLMLDKTFNRAEFATVALRLMGEGFTDAETEALNIASNFKDVEAGKWFAAYVGRAQKEGLVQGDPATNLYLPEDTVTYVQALTIVMRALGYEDGTDLVNYPSGYYAKAAQLGLADTAVDANAKIVRKVIADMLETALDLEVKGEGITLAEKLAIEEGTVTPGVPATLKVEEIKANSASSFQVTFNKAVTDEDKVTFEVKRGSSKVSLTQEYSEDAKSATLKSSTSLAQGEYSVSVLFDGKEASNVVIKIDAQKLAKIEIVSDVLSVTQNTGNNNALNQTGYALFVAYDQYGNDVTTTYHASGIRFMVGAATATHKDGVITVTPNANINLLAMPTISITAYDNTSAVSTTKSLKPSMAVGNIDSFEFKLVEDLVVTVGDTTTVQYVPFKAYDMSGNEIKNYELIKEGMLLNSNDELVVTNNFVKASLVQDPKNSTNAAIKVTAVNTTQEITIDMPFNITAMTKNGKVSTISGTLKPATKVAKFTLMAPTEVVADGETAVIPFEAYDSNGNKITKFNQLNTFVNVGNTLQFRQKVNGDAELVTTSTLNEGPAMFTSMVSHNGNFSTVTINVQKPAVISSFEVAQNTLALEEGGSRLLGFGYTKGSDAYSGLTVKDQYGRNVNMVLSGSNQTAKVNYDANLIELQDVNGNPIAANPATIGSGKSGVKVVAKSLAQNVKGITTNITFEFDITQNNQTRTVTRMYPVTIVDSAEIVDYKATPVSETLHTSDANLGGAGKYGTGFTVRGVTRSGSLVQLAPGFNAYANPVNTSDFYSVTDSVYGTPGNTIFARGTTTGYVAKDSTSAVTVTVVHNARVSTVEANVKSSVAAPYATDITFGLTHDQLLDNNTITFEDDILTGTAAQLNSLGGLKGRFTVVDSYGKKNVITGTSYTVRTISGNVAMTNDTITGTGDLLITAISSNGLVKTIKVEVQ